MPILDKSDKLKQSLYFPKEMLEEIHREADRLDRSLSWIVQRAWKVAKRDVQSMPSEPEVMPVDYVDQPPDPKESD